MATRFTLGTRMAGLMWQHDEVISVQMIDSVEVDERGVEIPRTQFTERIQVINDDDMRISQQIVDMLNGRLVR
jgi:hypothetical protein